jgi:UDP-N-acetylglucosamine 4-epimerase
VETLLGFGQDVVGVDNLSVGDGARLETIEGRVGAQSWSRFSFRKADIRNADECEAHCEDVRYVLHQAALTSVQGSIEEPLLTHENNVDGFLKLALAARKARVESFVYASSASVYGWGNDRPASESDQVAPISPYGTTKWINEVYADMLSHEEGPHFVGLRYFNVVGPGQDPFGSYAAVIPRWIQALVSGEQAEIYGDGETTRDFCSLGDVGQANLLAALTPEAAGEVFNVGSGEATRLIDLHGLLVRLMIAQGNPSFQTEPHFGPQRAGDIRRSVANIRKICGTLGYEPEESLEETLNAVVHRALANRPDEA